VIDPGLCGACLHVRRTGNARRSIFWLCERSLTDAGYPRYPRLPVLECPGFERRSPAGNGPGGRPAAGPAAG